MAHKTVVRNQAYQTKNFTTVERHNERKKERGLYYLGCLHADERNSLPSEQLGRDVYHYHLHVVYVPVVQKEIKWSKRTKDKSLIGKVKEVIPQISQSNKWPLRQQGEIDGRTVTLNSYSFLQDRYYEHVKEAGLSWKYAKPLHRTTQSMPNILRTARKKTRRM